MGYTKRMLAVFTVLVVVAAACSGDPEEDQAIVDEIVDDLIEESADPPDPEPDPDPETGTETDEPETTPEVVDPEPEPDPEPDLPIVQDNCVILRHYQAVGVFDAPYYVTVTTAIDLTDEDEVTVVMPDGNEFEFGVWSTDDDGPGQIDVDFPVFAPGDVVLPEIYVNGEPIHPDLQTEFWDGNSSFVAASSEIRDEEIYPTPPCTQPYFIQVEI